MRLGDYSSSMSSDSFNPEFSDRDLNSRGGTSTGRDPAFLPNGTLRKSSGVATVGRVYTSIWDLPNPGASDLMPTWRADLVPLVAFRE